MPRFMAYIWTDSDNPAECKFGDHWVDDDKSFEEAKQETIAYVRSEQLRSKHKFDDGRVRVHHVWDVSDYARRVGRFFKYGKVDNVIRHCIGFHIQADFHRIHYEDAIAAVNMEIRRFDGNLPEAKLSTLQYQALVDVLSAFAENKRRVLAELCARFGKTIWAGGVIRETQAPITVIASYVLTSFSSFIKDLTSFRQFTDIEHVEASDPNWVEKVKNHRAAGKQVVVYLSMCPGSKQDCEKGEEKFSISKRDQRIKTLYSKTFNEPVLLVVDEADFGVHTEKQAKPLISAQRPGDRVMLMTGTNAERAASGWDIDHYLSVTYPELLMMKAKAMSD
jgi:superfamily II DNA or RNA helicase